MTAVREVRAFVRTRRRRAPVGALDRYAGLIMTAIAVAVLGRPVADAVAGLRGPADLAGVAPGVAVTLVALAGGLALARAVGPVALSGSDAGWLVMSPLDRRAVLGRPLRVLGVVALVTGGVLGLALLALVGAPDHLVWRLVAAMVVGVSATAGGMALAVLAQTSHTWHLWLTAVVVALLVTAAVAAVGTARASLTTAAVTGTAAGAAAAVGDGAEAPFRGVVEAVAGAPLGAVAAVAAVAALASALLVGRAWARADRIPAAALLTSSARAGHLATAAVSLDTGALTWMAEDNHWRARRLRSVRWPSLPAPLALAWQDWLRTARRPWRLAATFAAAALPALLALAGAGAVAGAAVLGGALAVAAAGVSGARRDGDNPALARLLGVGRRPALLARALLPALTSGVWAALALAGLALAGALPPVGAWWLMGPLMAPALAAAALRMARRRPVDHSLPILDTGSGAIPLGPVFWAATGPDLALIGALPLVNALMFTPATLTATLVAQAVTGAAVLAAYVLRAR
ncbi:DUF6297 family protein [Nonomuraea sp. NPDC023979]|uniref:DUF6297 family protein n=1 Tax=Nonomuraea sp. NPDC023979 TaxID=3154796 RepID=UPI0033D3B1BC